MALFSTKIEIPVEFSTWWVPAYRQASFKG